MRLDLTEYLDYLVNVKADKPAPRTLKRYTDALKRVNLNDVDSENLTETYVALIPKIDEVGYVDVSTYTTVLSALLHVHGLPVTHNKEYHILMEALKKKEGNRAAYGKEDVMLLFAATRDNMELTKLLILMLYSGLRIGACYPLYYDKFTKVEGFDVWTYEVISKRVRYPAFISSKAFAALNRLRSPNQALVVQHDEGFVTAFHARYRALLNGAIQRNNLSSIREGKSIFHSMRKSYSQYLLGSGLEPTTYTFKVLMGHIPRGSTATKYYITPEGDKFPLDLIKRCAEAYAKTELATMGVGL